MSSRCHFICREPISVDAHQVYRPRCIPESKNVPDPCPAAALSPVLVVSRSLGCNMHNICSQVSNWNCAGRTSDPSYLLPPEPNPKFSAARSRRSSGAHRVVRGG